ncbi:MAG: pilus assembly PilX family protein [Thermodesulfobacteriota bacterium]
MRKFLSAWTSSSIYKNEYGMVTAVALLLVAVLTLLGTTAVVVTSTDILIGGNYKLSEQAFYAAEAGVEEARARLRGNATAKINDTAPSSPDWKAYIGTLAMAQAKGFNSGSLSHSRADSLQTSMNYVVEIRHKVDAANKVMYWDGIMKRNPTTGTNIYLVTSTGYTGNSNRSVEAEITRASPLIVPGPLYVEADAKIQGSSTNIIGTDPVTGKEPCGESAVAAVTTTNAASSVQIHQNSNVTGSPLVKEYGADLDVEAMVNSLKQQANISFNVTSDTHTGMNWGTPTIIEDTKPSTCSVHNIVYYNTNGTEIKLAGGSSGCGILLVDGDLDVNGGFAWHGVVVVTGSLKYTGGGNKQVTGGMLAGENADADVDVGGSASIVYCSSAVNSQTVNLPLRVLSWRDNNQK